MTVRAAAAAMAVLTLAVAACGGEDEDESAVQATTTAAADVSPTRTTTLENPADAGELAFEKDTLTAPAGTVTLVMENPSSEVHNISIEGDGLDEKGNFVGRGETSRVTAVLAPGDYTFYCSVPLHRDGGMEGTLTVMP